MHDLVIKAETTTSGTELYLDGMPLQGITEYELRQSVGAPIELNLRMYVNTVNKDDEVLKQLVNVGAITK